MKVNHIETNRNKWLEIRRPAVTVKMPAATEGPTVTLSCMEHPLPIRERSTQYRSLGKVY